jgi:hypothetical protein
MKTLERQLGRFNAGRWNDEKINTTRDFYEKAFLGFTSSMYYISD